MASGRGGFPRTNAAGAGPGAPPRSWRSLVLAVMVAVVAVELLGGGDPGFQSLDLEAALRGVLADLGSLLGRTRVAEHGRPPSREWDYETLSETLKQPFLCP